jgi:hypothetical protein
VAVIHDHDGAPPDGSAPDGAAPDGTAPDATVDGAPPPDDGAPPPDGAVPGCPCVDGVDNYCFYPAAAHPGCAMVQPGGYCDPDGDGDPADGDWNRGWYEYRDACVTACGDGTCDAPAESCDACPADCGACPADCGNGTCDGDETCLSCPGDCPMGAAVACSKLGAQTIGDTAPFYDLLGGCPRIAKWIGGAGAGPGLGFAQLAEMAAYKCACGGTTVLRVYGPADTYATGDDLWNARYAFLETAEPWQKAAVDYLESDNECDAGHCWFAAGDPTYAPSVAAMADYATFLEQWIARAEQHGFRPLVGNLSVGTPAGNIDDCAAGDGALAFGALVPALLAARDAGGGWGYHGYTDQWSQDAAAGMMPYKPFRYRKLIACHPEVATVPLVLTEAGFDLGGNPDAHGYLVNGGWAAYGPWLAWFQGQLDLDAYLVGAALFAFAPPGSWSSFRLDDHAGELLGLIGAPACVP